MLLGSGRAELERLGYSIVSESDAEVVGFRRKRHWDVLGIAQTSVVFLRATGLLTSAAIQVEAGELIARAHELNPSRLPVGVRNGMPVVVAYFADSVALDAQRLCESTQLFRPGALFFPAALDQSTGRPYYCESTPVWGAAYSGKLRFLVQRMLVPECAPLREPLSAIGIGAGALIAILLLAIVALLVLAVIVLPPLLR